MQVGSIPPGPMAYHQTEMIAGEAAFIHGASKIRHNTPPGLARVFHLAANACDCDRLAPLAQLDRFDDEPQVLTDDGMARSFV